MKQPEETAPEAKAQRHRRLRRERERSIVELKLLQRRPEVLIFGRVDGIHTGKHHGLDLLESLDGLVARPCYMRDGVAHLNFLAVLDAAYDVSHVAGTKLLARYHIHLEHPYLVGVIFHSRVKELHLVALVQCAVLNLEISDDAPERVEHRIKNQSLQRSVGVSLRAWYALNHGIEYLGHPLTCLSTGTYYVRPLATNQVDNLVFHLIGHCARHVYLVDNRYDFQVVVNGHVQVGNGLGLHALRGVDHEQRPLAGSNAPGYLVRKIHVARSVNKVKHILLSLILILHLYGMAFYRDAALALQVHVVEHLPACHLDCFRIFKHSVGKCRLAVVYMGNDTKVSYMVHVLVKILLLKYKDNVIQPIFKIIPDIF